MTGTISERVEQGRRTAPAMAAVLTEILVDNPAPFALVAAGGIVLGRAALSIVRPRNMLEALAVLAVVEFATPVLIRKAIDAGYLRFRIRNELGELVPFIPPGLDASGP